MWPSSEKIGPQLTYGISGNGYLWNDKTTTSQQPSLHFPRLHSHGPHLHLIANSTTPITASSPLSERLGEAIIHRVVSGPSRDVTVHDNVVASLALEAAPLKDNIGQDPSIGTQVAVVRLGTGAYADRVLVDGQFISPKVKTNVIDVQGVVFVTPLGNIKAVPILPKRRNLLHATQLELLKKTLVDTVALSLAAEYPFLWPIKLIEVSAELHLVAVRGLLQCCFLSLEWSNEPAKKGVKLRKAFEVSNSGCNWSQIVFNGNRFALVHVDGTIDIWLFSNTGGEWGCELDSTLDPKLYDPLDWSLWKRVCWPKDANHLVLFCRKSAHLLHLDTRKTNNTEESTDSEDLEDLEESEESDLNGTKEMSEKDETNKTNEKVKKDGTESKVSVTRLITTHYWSHLQDVALVGSYIFLLTSKELIWLKSSKQEPFERLLSWKHYLDDADTSMRLCVRSLSTSRTFVLCVYSKVSPIVIAYTFGLYDGKPCSLRDPYVFYTTKETGIANLAVGESVLLDSEPAPLMFGVEINPDSQVSFSNFCGAENWKFRMVEKVNGGDMSINGTVKEAAKVLTSDELMLIFKYFCDVLAAVNNTNDEKDEVSSNGPRRITAETATVNKISSCSSINNVPANQEGSSHPKCPTPEQIDVVQNYAFELGAEMKGIFDTNYLDEMYPQHHSLAAIAERIPSNVKDLSEFDSMIQQLGEFCEENGGRLDFGHKGLFQQEKSDTKHEALSTEYLASILTDPNQLSNVRAAVILVLSLVKAHSVEIEGQYEQLIKDELEGCSEDLKDIFDEWQVHSLEGLHVEQLNMDGSMVGLTSAPQPPLQAKINQEKKGLLKRALTQSSQAFKSSSQVARADQDVLDVDPLLKTSSNHTSELLFLSQFASSQESLDGNSPFSSQMSLGSQSRSQLGPRKKKKKKGGFA